MQKTMTVGCRRRLAFLVTALCVMMLPAMAGESYYAYNTHVETYPTGAGQVYVSTDLNDLYLAEEDVPQWSSSLDVKFASDLKGFFAFGKPNDGWQFYGYVKGKLDEETGEVTYSENYMTNLTSSYVPLTSTLTCYDEEGNVLPKELADSATVAKLIPETPNNYVRMLFTHVRAKPAEGQTRLGSTYIMGLGGSKGEINELGDNLVLYAFPEATSTFEGWYLDGKLVSAERMISVVVTGPATYEAHFSNPLVQKVNFPVGGGYLEWFSDYNYELDGQFVYAYNPKLANTTLIDAKDGDKRQTYFVMYRDSVILEGGIPSLIHGSGECTFYPLSLQPNTDVPSPDEMLFKWSGSDGLRLTAGNNYYVLSPSGEYFELEEGATIAPNRLYILLPPTMVNEKLGVPEKIFVDREAYKNTAGIGTIMADQKASRRGTYSLDGRRVTTPTRKGIYVTDGKKIYVK